MNARPVSGWLPGKNKSADQEKRPHAFLAVDLLLWVFCLSLLTDVNADHPVALNSLPLHIKRLCESKNKL